MGNSLNVEMQDAAVVGNHADCWMLESFIKALLSLPYMHHLAAKLKPPGLVPADDAKVAAGVAKTVKSRLARLRIGVKH